MGKVKKKSPVTRGAVTPICKTPAEMSELDLPSYEDVLRQFKWEQGEWARKHGRFNPPVATICKIVTAKIERIWAKASIPTVSDRAIFLQVLRSHGKWKHIRTAARKRRTCRRRSRSSAKTTCGSSMWAPASVTLRLYPAPALKNAALVPRKSHSCWTSAPSDACISGDWTVQQPPSCRRSNPRKRRKMK